MWGAGLGVWRPGIYGRFWEEAQQQGLGFRAARALSTFSCRRMQEAGCSDLADQGERQATHRTLMLGLNKRIASSPHKRTVLRASNAICRQRTQHVAPDADTHPDTVTASTRSPRTEAPHSVSTSLLPGEAGGQVSPQLFSATGSFHEK